MTPRPSWKGKNVLVLGLGQFPEGSGMAGACFALKMGATVRATDQKTEKELQENVKTLKKISKKISFRLGGHVMEDVDWADVVIRHQRVRRNAPELKRARKLGKEIVSAEGLFCTYCPAKIIGITGTRGKSTTTTLVAEMLRLSGKKVWIGGNILVSPLTFLDKVQSTDVVVLELSSFQTEVLGEEAISPSVAGITNIYQDHLNAYENMDEYAEAKAQIFRHQTEKDIVVLNADNEWTRAWMKEAPGKVISFSEKRDADIRVSKEWISIGSTKFIERKKLQVFGDHQAMNISAGIGIAMSAGATRVGMKKAILSFQGIPHRQEVTAKREGITYINDSTATMPDGLYAAVSAIAPRFRRMLVILGGQDKNLDFFGLGNVLRRKRVIVALLPGSASRLIEKELQKAKVPYTHVESLIDAIAVLRAQAQNGDAIVLSPAAASFGMFANEFDRGDQFRALSSTI